MINQNYFTTPYLKTNHIILVSLNVNIQLLEIKQSSICMSRVILPANYMPYTQLPVNINAFRCRVALPNKNIIFYSILL